MLNNLNLYFTYPLRVILLLIIKINLTLGQSNGQEDQGNLKIPTKLCTTKRLVL